MSTDNTLLSTEMQEVRESGAGAHQLIRIQLYVNRQWITPIRLDSTSIERDFEQGFADAKVISFLMMQGQYTFDILPYRNDIKVDVTYVPLQDIATDQRSNARAFTRRYRGFLMGLDNAALTSQVSNRTNRDAMDLLPPVQVEMQLVEEYIYELQARTVGGNYRNETPYNVLMSVLTRTLSYVEGSDEKRVLGVVARGIANPTRRTQVILKDGTPVGKVASVLQNQEGGVFSAGLGCYLQDQYWYVFPLYDTTHASKQSRTLTVYSVPTDRYEGSERTYRVTDNRLIILASGDALTASEVESQQLQVGNGLRFLDAKKLLGDFGVTQDNRMLVDRASNLFEVASKEITKGINNIQWAADRTSSNPLKHYSAIARLNGRVVMVEWLHGDCDLLEPGMLVEYMVTSEGEVKRFKGTLLGVHEVCLSPESGAVVHRHVSKVRLKLFIENQPDLASGA